DAEPSAVQTFLAGNRDSVLADRLRVEWLKSLGMRHEWTLFGAEDPLVQNEDIELACFALQYRRQFTDEVLAEARSLWFTGAATPTSCSPLFDELFARGQLRVDDVWQRFRLATEAGNVDVALWLNAALDEKQAIPTRHLERAARDADSVLVKRGLRLANRAEHELLLFALTREARSAPASAYAHWQK